MANNPIRFIDPDGKEIKDPDHIVKNYKSQLTTNRDALQSMMDSGNIGAESGNALMSFYNKILGEISKLEKSDQIYTIFLDNSIEGGIMRYDIASGEIQIRLGDNSIGVVGHELNHAYQYENREISLVTDNSALGQLYDIVDETDAYNRERALGVGIQFFQTPDVVVDGYPLKMSDGDIRSFGNLMNPPVYQDLPSGPININSKEGRNLRQQTREAGRLGIQVKEVYKDWQKDYRKGQKKRSQ